MFVVLRGDKNLRTDMLNAFTCQNVLAGAPTLMAWYSGQAKKNKRGKISMAINLIGYTDRLSARPGETLDFKISCKTRSPVKARLFRSISADANPSGMGVVEAACDELFTPLEFEGKEQKFAPGSYAVTTGKISPIIGEKVELSVTVMPTILTGNRQTVMSVGTIKISLNSESRICFTNSSFELVATAPISLNKWWKINAMLSADGQMALRVDEIRNGTLVDNSNVQAKTDVAPSLNGPLYLAARDQGGSVGQFFNGRIEAPALCVDGKVVERWNLADEMNSLSVPSALGTSGHALRLVNAPVRAVRCSLWDASEMCWRHKSEHYAAIHFNEDAIYDFGWDTSFSFELPQFMPSGIYVMRISSDEHDDAMPFFVCPLKGAPTAKLCVLVSTFTYAIYGNHARPDYSPAWQDRIAKDGAYPHNPAAHPEYGLSTYNTLHDGSGICHASYKRPLFNLRPGYITFGAATCSGLRHFQADSHLISWLHDQNIDYDIITDDELDREGVEVIKGYDAVMTGTHPEYHTMTMLDALMAYRDGGGRLIYLGGNGFYWRIVRHGEDPDLLEIRRAEDGLRAWASQTGEYYNAFDGSYGGLWRRNARPPQQLVGIGFTAQGLFVGKGYKRICFEPAFDWVFDGIDDDVIGDFGFSGNGAAGFELDRVDSALDNGLDITILAQSFGESFMLVPEEQLTHLTNLSGGSELQAKRADMVYVKTSLGGEVFAVGSITFCGSLPWNNFDNNVSRLLRNVVNRFLGAA